MNVGPGIGVEESGRTYGHRRLAMTCASRASSVKGPKPASACSGTVDVCCDECEESARDSGRLGSDGIPSGTYHALLVSVENSRSAASFMVPVNKSTLPSVLLDGSPGPLPPVGGGNGAADEEGEEGEEDKKGEGGGGLGDKGSDKSYEVPGTEPWPRPTGDDNSTCISHPQVVGCERVEGACKEGGQGVIWENPETILLYNWIVSAVEAFKNSDTSEGDSLGSASGNSGNQSSFESQPGNRWSARYKACGKPDDKVACRENLLIYAVLRSTGAVEPTMQDVWDAMNESREMAIQAAKQRGCVDVTKEGPPGEHQPCPFQIALKAVWRAGFAANLLGGELAGLALQGWDQLDSENRQRGGPGLGESPLAGRDGFSYYVCSATEVSWVCSVSPADPPPPGAPEDPPPPDTGPGGTMTPPDGGSLVLGPVVVHSGEQPPNDNPCSVVDEASKCCYFSKDSGKCVNYGCWEEGTACVPSKSGDDCDCVRVGAATSVTEEANFDFGGQDSGLVSALQHGEHLQASLESMLSLARPAGIGDGQSEIGPIAIDAPHLPVQSPRYVVGELRRGQR